MLCSATQFFLFSHFNNLLKLLIAKTQFTEVWIVFAIHFYCGYCHFITALLVYSYEVRIIFKFCLEKDILLRSDCFDGIYMKWGVMWRSAKQCNLERSASQWSSSHNIRCNPFQKCLVQCLVQKHGLPRSEFGETSACP